MSLGSQLKRLFTKTPLQAKESQARIVNSFYKTGEPVMTPANYESFAHKGYGKNAVVYTAINKITTACSGIDWLLYEKKAGRRRDLKELENSPLLDLIEKPNPMQSTSAFIESMVGFYLISGNSYVEANKPSMSGPPLELWTARPDRMRVVPGADGYPQKYVYKHGEQERNFPVDRVGMKSDILHMKTFNPTSDWYGQSPLEAALASLDQYNSGQKWNLSLLQNEARPSGILQMRASDSNPRGTIGDDQFERLKKEFDDNYGGVANAGRPMVIEGGLEWKTLSLSPKDMDFLNLKGVTATDLALIYGVPPEMIGLGEKTFANYKEARLSFYEETIIPHMNAVRDSLNMWLTPTFGENLHLEFDKDSIEALVEKREAKYTSLGTVSFLDQNEKRVAAGYDEVDGMDVFIIGPNMVHRDEFKGIAEDATKPKPEPIEDPDPEDVEDPEPEPGDEDAPEDDDSGSDGGDDLDADPKGLVGADLEFKSFNLLNRNEKVNSWRIQNRIREDLTKDFRKDLDKDYKALQKQLSRSAKLVQGLSPLLVEYALVKEATDWADSIERTLSKHTEKSLRRFGDRILGEAKSLGLLIETKNKSQYDSFVLEYVKQRTGVQITSITSTTEKKIRRVVKEWTATAIQDGDTADELSKFIGAEFEDISKSSAQRIARTEVGAASSNGSLEAAKALNVPGLVKEWIAAGDDRVRNDSSKADHASVNSINGEIPVDDEFEVNPGISMKCPQADGAPAEQVINCRCVCVYRNADGE